MMLLTKLMENTKFTHNNKQYNTGPDNAHNSLEKS